MSKISKNQRYEMSLDVFAVVSRSPEVSGSFAGLIVDISVGRRG